ncbi:VCBS domain-containing protein [Agarivorans sp. 1_MG-2023]|uniref:VCBS domain-containing protein n=1 Tax=Agarivorans sp. 1_MG-2023 TaxID=3062634 RepID=UPI0026E3338A|nr:VCBS domain-containing protein [Agarivorans sp. 1_MG-2023]MDO6765135.1 VCBS domain-containing protein [Agarivorans sp. 1_MG-2023]
MKDVHNKPKDKAVKSASDKQSKPDKSINKAKRLDQDVERLKAKELRDVKGEGLKNQDLVADKSHQQLLSEQQAIEKEGYVTQDVVDEPLNPQHSDATSNKVNTEDQQRAAEVPVAQPSAADQLAGAALELTEPNNKAAVQADRVGQGGGLSEQGYGNWYSPSSLIKHVTPHVTADHQATNSTIVQAHPSLSVHQNSNFPETGAPVLHAEGSQQQSGTVKEDNVSEVSGNLHVAGAGSSAAVWSVESGAGLYGQLTVDPSTGEWRYRLDNSLSSTNALAEGEHHTEQFVVLAKDSSQNQVKMVVSVEVEGSNDKPQISGLHHANVTEMAALSEVDGQLFAKDPDHNEQLQWAVSHSLGQYGRLTINPDNGQWQYQLDNKQPATLALVEGQKSVEHFVVSVTDSTGEMVKQDLSIQVVGTNEHAVIGGGYSGVLTEDKDVHSGQLSVAGALTVTDVDNGQNQFQAESIQGQFGTFLISNIGHWTYTADNSQTVIQGLKTGDSITDTVMVHSVDGTTQKVIVTINGTDDKAVIAGTSTASLTEDKDLHSGLLRVDGALTVTDADNGQNQFQAESIQGQFGTLSINSLGHWIYTADNSQTSIQGLKTGDSVTDTVMVHSVDGTSQKVTVTINGTDDKAVIAGTSTANLSEDKDVYSGQLRVDGALTVTDEDNGQNQFQAESIQGQFGTLSINNLGHWTYTADNSQPGIQSLKTGDSVTDTVLVHSVDGTEQKVSVTINGTDDKAVIAGTSTASLTEGKDLHSGQLRVDGVFTVTDVDNGQNQFQAESIQGQFGTLSINNLGHWTYTADNSKTSIQGLKTGDSVTDTVMVHSVDGTSKKVTVTINGTDDKAVIAGTSTARITEDKDVHSGLLRADGALTITDVDNGQNQFQAESIQGQFGTLSINNLGHWTYTADNSQTSIQGLKTGDTVTDTVMVHSVDGTSEKVTVTINGTDDKAIIAGVDTASVDEGHGHYFDMSPDYGKSQLTSEALYADGKLDITDPDSGENKFDTHGGGYSYSGQYGRINLHEDGTWHYMVDIGHNGFTSGTATTNVGTTIDKLGDGDSLTDTITVYSKDGTAHDIVVTIHGDNDAPYCSSEVQLNSGKEDIAQTLTLNQLLQNTVDVDTNDAGQLAIANLQVDHGSIAINTDGTFTFTPAKDYNGPVHFNYDVKDAHGGVTHTGASLDLAAVDDAAIISGQSTGDVDEGYGTFGNRSPDYAQAGMAKIGQGALTADGKLDIVDPDTGESQFDPKGGAWNNSYHGQYGHLLLNTDGTWHYDVPVGSVDWVGNRKTTVGTTIDKLGEGQTLTDTITIQSKDGTTHDIVITIHGDNDKPYCSSEVQLNSGKEDTAQVLTLNQLLQNTVDVDANDAGKLTIENLHADHGSILDNKDGTFTFTPAKDYNGQVNFNYDVKDAHGGVTHTGASLDLAAVDDAAIISGLDTGDINESSRPDRSPDHAHPGMGEITNDLLYVDGKLNIIDGDSGENTFDSKGLGYAYHGQYGNLMLLKDGTWHYNIEVGQQASGVGRAIDKLGKGESLTDTITVYSKDGTAHDIVITIHGDNDKPYCSSEVQLNSGKEDTAQVLTLNQLLQNTVDVDANDAGQLTIENLHADHGSILDNKDGTFTFTPAKDYNGDVHFNYDVKDAHGGVTHTGANMTLASQQDAATFSGVDTGNITEDKHVGHSSAQTIAVSGSLAVTDPDAGQDHIDYSQLGEQAIHDPFHGSLHITPQGSWGYSVKNSALQYLHEGDVENVVYRVYSADGTSHDITITVTGTNDAPVLAAQTQSVIEDGSALQGQMQATDVDYNSHPILSYEIANPVDGLTFNADGSYTFDPTHASYQHLGAGQEQTITIPVTVKDEVNATSTQNLTITVHGTNDAPTISGIDTHILKEDVGVNPQSHNLTATGKLDIADIDAGESSFVGHGFNKTALQGHYGHLQISPDGSWGYFADNSQTAIQTLGNNEYLTDTLQVTSIDGTTHDIVITINGTNDAPTITPVATQTVTEDGSKTITFHATDVDTTDTLTPSVSATHGTAALNAQGQVVFTPDANYNGPATVVLSVTDGQTSTSQTITVDVTSANDAPVINTIAPISATEDGSVVTGQIASTDTDTGDTASFKTTFTKGGFTLTTDGSYKLDPTDASFQHLKAGEIETLTIPVTVTDSAGATDTKDLVITITGTNDIPIITGVDTGSITEDINVQGMQHVLAFDGQLQITDPDTGESKFDPNVVKDAAGTHVGYSSSLGGSLLIDPDTGDYSYRIDNANPKIQELKAGETIIDHITVSSVDGTSHEISITIHGTNDAAVISGTDSGAVTEDLNSAHSVAGTLSITDADTDEAHFSNTDIPGSFGTLHLIKSGAWVYDLDNNNPAVQALGKGTTATDIITVTSVDGTTHQVTITVNGTNDSALISGVDTGTLTEDITTSNNNLITSGHLTVSDSDTDEAIFQVSGTGNGAQGIRERGSLVVSDTGLGSYRMHANGEWDYTANNHNPKIQSLAANEVLQDTLTIHSADGTAHTITINIHGTNDVPTLSVTQTTPTTGTLTETDIDLTDTHSFSVVHPTGQFGVLSVDPNSGAYVYTPNASVSGMSYNSATHTYHGADVFEVKVVDNHGGESSRFVTFDTNGQVTSTNGQPPSISTTVPQNPIVTTAQPTLPAGTNTPPSNTVTVDLAASTDTGTSDTDNLTNNNTPTITGQTDIPYSQVTIYDGSIPIGHAVSDASGQYNAVVSNLADGDHNLSAKALAPSSVLPATSSLLSVHVDTTIAPLTIELTHDTGSSTSDLISSDGALTISGQEAGAAVEYSTDNGQTWTSSFTPQPGSNTVSVRQTDIAGNISTSTSLRFTLDDQIAAPSIDLKSSTDSGISATDNLTNIHTPIITGSAEANSIITITDETGKVIATGTANNNGIYQLTTSDITEGKHTLTVEATDIAGNHQSNALALEVDYTAPNISKVNLKTETTHQPTFSGTVSVDTAHVDIVIKQGNTVIETLHASLDGKGSYSVDANNLPDGHYTAYIHATDKAGNQTPSGYNGEYDNFSVDTHAKAPTITFESTGSDNSYNAAEVAVGAANTITASIHLPDDVYAADTLIINGVSHVISNTDYVAGLVNVEVSPGSTLSASIIDSEGNQSTLISQIAPVADLSAAPLTLSLTHDTGSSTADLITNDGTLTINGQEAGAAVEYSSDGGHTWTSSFTPQPGANNVSVRQTDSAGNISPTSSLSFTLDNQVTAPSVSLRSDTSGELHPTADLVTQDARLSIQAEAGAQVEYSNDGGHSWSSMFNPVEGVNNLLVRQTDIAGNQSATTHFSFTLDTTPGTVSVNPISTDNALNAVENNQALVITGTTSNIAAGDRVYLNFGNNHFREASVHSDGTWSLTVSASDHQRYFSADGSYPIKIGTVDLAGNATPEISTHLIVDTQNPIPHISVDSVTRDNIINLAESGQNIDITGHVSGDFNVGDVVSLSVNGATISALTGVVDSQGNYSISVPAQTLIKANIHSIYASGQQPVHSIEATVITTDQAGNIGSATTGTQAFSIDKVASANIQLDPVTADNVINAAESNHNVSITGHVSGDVQQGEIVNILVGQQTHTGIVDQHGQFSIDVAGSELTAQTVITATVDTTDNAGNLAHASQTLSYAVDTQVDMPTITFESPGSDNAYSKAEIAQGHAGTITATVHAAADAKIGEHININGVDHIIDANSLSHGISLEVAPSTIVKAIMTDEHGNVSSNLNIAAGAKPEPIVVKAPSGSHQISASLGIPTLIPTQTPVPVAEQGWKILVNGHYETTYNSQWGTLSIHPKTGELSYHEHANTYTGPHGSAQSVGIHEDRFEVALQGSHHDDVIMHVQVSILSHGPGHSGKLTLGSEVLDMTVTPVVGHHAQPSAAANASDAPLDDDVVDVDLVLAPSDEFVSGEQVEQLDHHHESKDEMAASELVITVQHVASPVEHYFQMVGMNRDELSLEPVSNQQAESLPELNLDNPLADDASLAAQSTDPFDNPLAADEHHHQLLDDSDESNHMNDDNANVDNHDDELLHSALNNMHNQW